MKRRNNIKGFGLLGSVLIILVLFIMAAGFLQVTEYSRKSVDSSVKNMKLYWAAESASNYNVNWWVNLPEDQRIDWPSTYTPVPVTDKSSDFTVGGGGITQTGAYNDLDGVQALTSSFSKAAGTTQDDIIYLHRSSLDEGNTETPNPELENQNGYKLLLTRYKGPRAGHPEQAVWILDSYAWDEKTGEIANIVLANVYNYKPETSLDLGWLDYAEGINKTMYGSGSFTGRKGVYYEYDYRYGDTYFNDLVRFDYKSSSSKKGPTFYGTFKTSSDMVSRYGSSPASPILFDDMSTNYTYGIFAESNSITSQAQAISNSVGIGSSLLGGYETIDPLPTEGVIWPWEDVVKFGAENNFYFLPKDLFNSGDKINIELFTETIEGQVYTYANIWKNDLPTNVIVKKLPINNSRQGYKAIAVEGIYGSVSIKGVSKDNFSLITEKNFVELAGDFYLYELHSTKLKLEQDVQNDLVTPTSALLKSLYDSMITANPENHLSIISCLNGQPPANSNAGGRVNSFFITSEETMFLSAALISYYGDMSAAGNIGTSQNTGLKFFNIGSFLILGTSEEYTGTNSSKYAFALIQDQRYLAEEEPLPPGWGFSPGSTITEYDRKFGLNGNHKWSKLSFPKANEWEKVVWRNLP